MNSPKGFKDQDIDGLFLRNAGQYIIIFFILGVFYIFLILVNKITTYLTRNSTKYHSYVSYTLLAVHFFEWGLFIGGFEGAYLSKSFFFYKIYNFYFLYFK
jgi:hypothetical protein